MNFKITILLFLLFFVVNTTMAQFQKLSQDSLLILLEDCEKEIDKVLILKELAFSYKNTFPVEALVYAEEAYRLAKDIDFEKGRAEALHTIGLVHFYLGDYDLALNHYLDALSIREQIEDKVGMGRSYNNIGVIYKLFQKYDFAENYFQKGLKIRVESQDSIGIVYSYNNLGEIQLIKGDTAKAIQNFEIGLAMATLIEDKKGQAFTNENLGNLFLQKQEYEEALRYFNTTLELRKAEKNDYEIARNYNSIGKIKCLQDNYSSCLYFLLEGLKIAKKLDAKPLQKNIYQNLAKAYATQNDFEQAYVYQTLYDLVKDSLVNEGLSKELLGLEAKYEFEKKERLLLEQESKIMDLHRSYTMIASILFLCFIGILYYRYRKQIQVNQYLKAARNEIIIKNKQLAKNNRELEQFAYIASHDLKEPLRNISGFALLLDRRYRSTLDVNGQQYLNFIMNGVEQMTDLLKDLLQYSEVKRLKKEDLQWIDLNDVIANIKNGLNGQLSEKNGRLLVSDLPSIHSNSFQMTQLFKNFITNSLKFQEDGKTPVVEVTGKELSDNWEFRVSDNGIGIDESYHDKIFEMFKRLHKRQDYEGTGMGLAICKQIVEQHKGEIRIESEKGSGTTFIFTFPKEIIRV